VTTRFTLAVLALLSLLMPASAGADLTAKAFAGATTASRSGFFDLDGATGKSKLFFGGAFGWEWSNGVGVELELAAAPSFLKGSNGLVESGSLTTVMANATWLLPRPSTRLRAYLSGGVGAARVTFQDALGAFTETSTLAAASLGGGVLVPVSGRARIIGDARYVHSQYGEVNGAGFGEEYVAYWRVTGGVLLGF
jgi:hypothetical protein